MVIRMKLSVRALAVLAAILLVSAHALTAEIFPARVMGAVDEDTLRVSRREGGTAVSTSFRDLI